MIRSFTEWSEIDSKMQYIREVSTTENKTSNFKTEVLKTKWNNDKGINVQNTKSYCR